jgi:AmiR/NasT family two-component response regulator
MAMWDRTAKLAQAQGIITVQADCTFDEALRMMLERAQVAHQSLSQIAEGVVAHRIWFG